MKPAKNCTDIRYKCHNLFKKSTLCKKKGTKFNFADTQTDIFDQFSLGF